MDPNPVFTLSGSSSENPKSIISVTSKQSSHLPDLLNPTPRASIPLTEKQAQLLISYPSFGRSRSLEKKPKIDRSLVGYTSEEFAAMDAKVAAVFKLAAMDAKERKFVLISEMAMWKAHLNSERTHGLIEYANISFLCSSPHVPRQSKEALSMVRNCVTKKNGLLSNYHLDSREFKAGLAELEAKLRHKGFVDNEVDLDNYLLSLTHEFVQ